MTVLSRKLVRTELADGLRAAVTGIGKPVSTVYDHRVGKLNGESPVLLVISGESEREIQGMGAHRFSNSMTFEIHSLIYDGDQDQPLTEIQREDTADEIEAQVAGWIAEHQRGINYQALEYAQPTDRIEVQMLDGNPYMLEIIYLSAKGTDQP